MVPNSSTPACHRSFDRLKDILSADLRQYGQEDLPEFVPPMMAESAKSPFDSPDFVFEIKLDGHRAITVFDAAGKPHLWSRKGMPLELKFPAVAEAVFKLKRRSTILDGGVGAVDEKGIPRFQLLPMVV